MEVTEWNSAIQLSVEKLLGIAIIKLKGSNCPESMDWTW